MKSNVFGRNDDKQEKCTIRVCKRSFTREAEALAMSVKRELSPE